MYRVDIGYIEDFGDFKDFLQQIADSGRIDGHALGVIRQVIGQGLDSLSEKQNYVLEHDVLEPYRISRCSCCRINILWCEMFEAYHNGGLCEWCSYMMDKDD
jgi:hypothetical protein